ncbi:hypothetical protein DFS34DRAFT_212694 [Phlyctochytrium arcticum]|nr:hypothetical protein DFS34DRAFT_212694 [Phlyctochytrium arcticum]
MSAAHSKWAALALIFTIPLFLYALFLLIVSAQGFSVNFIGYQLPRWTDSDSIETGIRIGFLVAGVAGVLSGTCSMLTIAFCFRKHFYISTPFKLFLVPAMVTLLSGLAFMGFGIYAISTREDGHAWVVVTVMGAVLLGFIGGVLLGLTMLHRDRSGVKLQPYKRPSVEEMRVHSDG